MKKMILTAVVLASNAYGSNIEFGDLNYLLPASRYSVGVQTELRSSENTQSFVDEKTSWEVEGWYNEALFTYGVNDQLNLFGGLNYRYDVGVSANNSTKYNLDGLENPLFGGVYRLVSQGDAAFNFDVGAVGRLNVEDEESGGFSGAESKDGNAADGRNSIELFARMGNKWNEANEWQGSAGLVYHMSGERTFTGVGGASDSTIDVDSSMDLFLRGIYQYRPVPEFMMAFEAKMTFVGTKEEESQGESFDYDSHLDLDFTYKAKYLVTSNVIANFTLGVSRLPDYDVDFGEDSEIKRRRASRLGVGVDWLF
jgi:hypothetical protein